MEGKHPLISVIIPAYNAEAFISQTLDSVLGQTYHNIEVLVVDDGSQDQTAAIIQGFVHRDSRVTLFQQSNQGVAAARNLAIQKSKGAYIAPIDADDIWYPQKLEKQVQCLATADASVGLVYAWSAYINEKGIRTGGRQDSKREGNIYPPLVYGNLVGNASACLIRRVCFEEVGNYNCQLKAQNAQGCEDWALYLRIAERYQFRVVPEILVGYRQMVGTMSGNHRAMLKSYCLVMAEVRQRHPELPAKLYQWSCSNFYTYLAEQSSRCGNHWGTLFWLSKAVQLDFMPLLLLSTYKKFGTSLLKFTLQPVTGLIWQDHRAWLEFRKKFRLNYSFAIATINRQGAQRNRVGLKWRLYEARLASVQLRA